MRILGPAAILALCAAPAFAQQEPPELRARLTACFQPVNRTAYADIVAICTALLEDKSVALSNERLAGVHLSRANAYDALHDSHAGSDYDSAVVLSPGNALIYYNRGVFYGAQHDVDRAAADFSKAISLDASMMPAHFALANIALGKGDFATAVARFTSAIALEPRLAQAYLGRAIAEGKLGKGDDAVADIKKALQLDPALAKDIQIDGKPAQ
jgi:tetratricopeptide (TPR) repeat protein